MSDHQTHLSPKELAEKCWFLTGPTAAGKSAVSLVLAEKLNAEILSLDSMAVYRGMDIGTAKPSTRERSLVPHYLIDLIDPTETFSVSTYINTAAACVRDILDRKKTPLFVGGTPLYLKTLLRGIFEGPPADWTFRNQIEAELQTIESPALHQRLERVDPLSAAKLHPNDTRRIIRALEVYRATGTPISHLQTEFEEGLPADRCRVFTLHWPRPQLHNRIETRVDAMYEAGLIEETRTLLSEFTELSHTAAQAVGYQETIAHIRGELLFDEAVEAVKARTRQFARRQETWFRGLSECQCVAANEFDSAEALADEILNRGRETRSK